MSTPETIASAAGPFSASELEALHNEDRAAARYVVSLMVAIFTLGLIGYVAVWIWVASS
jgi:hypothetical protein